MARETVGQIARHAADARVARRKTRTREHFDEIVDLFALGERVKKDGHRTAIHRETANTEQVRADAGEFAAEDADRLPSRRKGPAHEFFDGHRVGDVVCERREVIQPIRVGDELVVVHVLGDLFVAAMQVTDVGSRLRDDLAVHFQNEPQHAMRSRVARAHVDDHFLAKQVGDVAGFFESGLGFRERVRRFKGSRSRGHRIVGRIGTRLRVAQGCFQKCRTWPGFRASKTAPRSHPNPIPSGKSPENERERDQDACQGKKTPPHWRRERVKLR